MIKRIHICGIYGAGKSVLARHLSSMLNIPCYSLDDFKYETKYSKIRPFSERVCIVQKICGQPEWITEGTWSDYAEDAFKNADLIIFLSPPRHICYYRILKRYIFRKKEKNDTLIGAFKLIRNVHRYYKTNEPVSFAAHLNIIKKYGKRSHMIRNKKQLKALLKTLLA